MGRWRCRYCTEEVEELGSEEALDHLLRFHPVLVLALADFLFEIVIEEETTEEPDVVEEELDE